MVWERRVVMMQLAAMLICATLPMTWAGLERMCTHEQSQYHTKHLCGAQLANVIQMMCRMGKRSSDATGRYNDCVTHRDLELQKAKVEQYIRLYL